MTKQNQYGKIGDRPPEGVQEKSLHNKSRRALQLSKQVAGSFKGKEQVRFPGGLCRKQ